MAFSVKVKAAAREAASRRCPARLGAYPRFPGGFQVAFIKVYALAAPPASRAHFPASSDPVHHFKDTLVLHMDVNADLLPDLVKLVPDLLGRFVRG